MTEYKQRTLRQSSALHLWFEHLATELNDAGLSVQKTLAKAADIPWSAATIKENLFKQIMWLMYQKKSTTELTTKELSEVVETVMRYLAENFSLHVEYPSLDSQLEKSRVVE